MAFRLEEFTRIRPYLFHTTAVENLTSIRSTRSLVCAKRFTGWPSSEQRLSATEAKLNGAPAWLQTQGKLRGGQCDFEPEWDLSLFLNLLNHKIFFWPGKGPDDPIDYGIRHRDKNDWPGNAWVTIRVESELLIHAAQFARCNSGAPRISNSVKAIRGPLTFVEADVFAGTACDIIEVVFADELKLPATAGVFDNRKGRWERLLQN